MPVKVDIREYKNSLRAKYKDIRKNFLNDQKSIADNKILNNIVSLSCYKECETLLTFVSTKIEVDTFSLIKKALKDGKKVAVPKCIDNTRLMDFYLIESLDQLEVATFSVLEPIISKCEKLTDFSNSICLVPGLAFDQYGYRLGYGKGYYDRFLSNYSCKRIGICYCNCTLNRLINGRFDQKVDLLITEKYIKKIKKDLNSGGKNG